MNFFSRNSASLASGTQPSPPRTITADELLNLEPTLHLRLIDRARQMAQAGHGPNLEGMLEGIFRDTAAQVIASTSSSQNALSNATHEELIQRVRRIFDDFKKQVEGYRDQIMSDFDRLTPEQQEEVCAYFEASCELICDMFAWLDKVINFTVAKLKAGYSLDRDAMKALFGGIKKQLADLFKTKTPPLPPPPPAPPAANGLPENGYVL